METIQEAGQAGATNEAAAAAASEPKAPRVKLTLKHGDQTLDLLKYPFPVKASKFPIVVNGVKVDAATTAGRGKAYTYMLINNTSFYVAGTLPVDAECTINFPDGYKFDDKVAPRVSNYKPKKKAKAEGDNANGDNGNGNGGEASANPGTEGAQAAAAAPAAPAGDKAARRKK